MTWPKQPATFDFARVPFLLWNKQLQSFKEQGISSVRCPVFWGNHESAMGVRDFGRTSRLKIEKLLSLAFELQLEIEIVVGFFPARESFPQWVWERRTPSQIPLGVWDGISESADTIAIPSLEEPEVFSEFLHFLGELFQIVNLYRRPEGPVNRIIFHDDLFSLEQSSLLYPTKQKDLKQFNERYLTSFGRYPEVFTETTIKLLSQRRPWLIAFDLKNNRVERLASRMVMLTSKFDLVVDESCNAQTEEGDWNVWVDPTGVESTATQLFPFIPFGQLNADYLEAYRISHYWKDGAVEHGANFSLTDPLAGKGSVTLLVCGKYISKEYFERVTTAAKEGRRFYFAYGLPVYDENLETLRWPQGGISVMKDLAPDSDPFGKMLREVHG